MKINLSFVPPGGGETDYSIPFELPEVPRAGDYISISRPGNKGVETFIVKRSWWNLSFDEARESGVLQDIWVECEFATSELSSEAHKKACIRYESRTGVLKEFDASMY